MLKSNFNCGNINSNSNKYQISRNKKTYNRKFTKDINQTEIIIIIIIIIII